MEIEVIANISEEEKVTVKFDKLSLQEALEKLSTNFGFVTDSENNEEENDSGKMLHITRIIVLPKGEDAASSRYTTNHAGMQEKEKKESSQQEPLKFEFDPSEFIEKDKE